VAGKATLTFAGDASQLLRTFKDVDGGAASLGQSMRSSLGGFDGVRDGFDAIDTGAMGFRDSITGVQDSMAGWKMLTADTTAQIAQLGDEVDRLKKSQEDRLASIKKQEEERLAQIKENKREELDALKEKQAAELRAARESEASAEFIAAMQARHRDEINATSDTYDQQAKDVKDTYADQAQAIKDATEEQTAALTAQMKELESQSGSTAEALLLIGMGVGDLASGFANLIVPLSKMSWESAKAAATHAKTAAVWVASNTKMVVSSVASAAKATAVWVFNAAKAAASVVASVAVQVGAWIMLGVQSLLAAAKVAIAWLIAMGPIALVIAAVIGLVALIIWKWDDIKRIIAAGWEWVKSTSARLWDGIKRAVTAGIDAVKTDLQNKLNLIKGVFNAFKTTATSIWKAIGSAMTAPIRSAVNAIKSIWNNTLGGKGISIPSWVPGYGGRSFTIPRLAAGGIVPATPGGRLAVLGEGGQDEAVIPLDRLAGMGGGTTVIELRSGGSRLDEVLVEILRESISARGGDVQVVLGR